MKRIKVSYGEGRRSRHGFFPIGHLQRREREILPDQVCDSWYDYMGTLVLGRHRRMSRKAIEKHLIAANLPDVDRVIVPHWNLGYADLYIEFMRPPEAPEYGNGMRP